MDMRFLEAAANRCSYRKEFTQDPVSPADLERILQAGVCAPSGYNHQTTSFLYVTDQALRENIAKLMPTPATTTAPLFIVPVSEHWEAENGLSFEIEDYAAATENIMLAITALGYAGVWMDGITKLDNNGEKLEALLHVPKDRRVRALIPVGKPMYQVPQKEKKPLSERAFLNTWPEK